MFAYAGSVQDLHSCMFGTAPQLPLARTSKWQFWNETDPSILFFISKIDRLITVEMILLVDYE